jgi:hypothetical protein
MKMYSSEYVNHLLEEIELLKRQKQELIKGGEIVRNKYNQLQTMLDEDNNKLIKETERADQLSDLNYKLQNEMKKLKSANEYLQKSLEIVKEDLSYVRNKK